jgi:oligopeptide transport system permease protein
MSGATIGYAIPNFVLAILLVLLFGLTLGWLPVGGWGSFTDLILPAIALGLPWAGLIARMTRAATLDTLYKDYVRTARAKGAGSVRVVVRHAFRNALLPLTTIIAIITSEIITGSLVIENIFGIPGLGHYVTDAVLGADYTMTLGLVVFYAGLVFIANFLVDLSYSLLDPTVSFG